MTKFGIVGLQLTLARQDNMALLAEEVAAAKRRMPWIEMVVLGELSAFGPALAHAETLPGPTENGFGEIARAAGVWLVNGSLYERDGDAIYNTATAFDPNGNVVARHRKVYPFLPYECDVSAGKTATVFDVPGVGRIGLLICYDIWFPELARSLAWQGAEVIVNTVMTNTIDRETEVSLARAAAAANQCYVVSVNVAGDLGVGRSVICGPGGELVHLAGTGREVIAVDLDLDHVRRCRAEGWHGLGQVLKSFREGPQTFDVYGQQPAASAVLAALGPIALPRQDRSTADQSGKGKILP